MRIGTDCAPSRVGPRSAPVRDCAVLESLVQIAWCCRDTPGREVVITIFGFFIYHAEDREAAIAEEAEARKSMLARSNAQNLTIARQEIFNKTVKVLEKETAELEALPTRFEIWISSWNRAGIRP